jgi:hypothetical protein
MRTPRLAVFAAAIVAACATASLPAHAWQEAHEVTDEVKVLVDPDGTAHFDHAIAYRVVRGPLRAFDVIGVEKSAVPDKDVLVTAPDGRELTAQAEMHDPSENAVGVHQGVLRVTVDEPRALMRGTFVFHVKYKVDLVAAQELVRDGAMWRLAWAAPVANEGFDGGRFTFTVPAAPTEPRALNPATGATDESILSTLHRAPDHDELELVRPHVSRGEAAAWTIRLDPRAFPEVSAPQLRPPPPPPAPPPDRATDVALGVALLAIAALYALLVAHKDRAVCLACEGIGRLRALVPLPRAWRAFLAGVALAGATLLEVVARPTTAAIALAAAVALAALRAPAARPAARGPGHWLAIRPEDAFVAAARRHWLDIGGRAGKITAACVTLLLAGAAIALWRIDSEAPYFVALDSVVLLPIFLTGRASQAPPDLARAPAAALGALFERLRKRKRGAAELRVVPWARIPTGRTSPDELRLLVLPRVAMPGLLGIEVGVAWGRTPTGYAPSPEVLVRVQELTSAAARVSALAPGARAVPGRRADERVVRLVPRATSRAGTAALVERLASELVDRRKRIAERAKSWSGLERRLPLKVAEQSVAAQA